MLEHNIKEDAFTGLEAAIILISFLVVTAVFSYVMLGIGFFNTQKSEGVIQSGINQAATNLELKGEVYGISSNSTEMHWLRFDLGLAPGGYPVNMEKTTLVFSTGSKIETLTPGTIQTIPQDMIYPSVSQGWGISACTVVQGYNSTNLLLEGGEIMTIWAVPTESIKISTPFSIEIKPSNGASFFVKRITPDAFSYVQILR